MTKIIFDCDPGIDDGVALAVALTDPALELELISTVAGNVTVDKTSKNALKLVEFFNKEVPVAAGAKKPLIKQYEDASHIHGQSGMDGYDFPKPQRTVVAKDAVVAMHELLQASPEPLTILATGAYTNLALLLAQYPEDKAKIKQVILMGGTLSRGNMSSVAEFNVYSDPQAAEIVFKSGLDLVMVGLDVTLKGRITEASQQAIAKCGPAGQMLDGIISADGDKTEAGTAIHDLQTVFYLQHPEAFTTKDYWVDVVTEGPALGATVADVRAAYHQETNVKVCLDIDTDAFNEWFVNKVKDNMQ